MLCACALALVREAATAVSPARCSRRSRSGAGGRGGEAARGDRHARQGALPHGQPPHRQPRPRARPGLLVARNRGSVTSGRAPRARVAQAPRPPGARGRADAQGPTVVRRGAMKGLPRKAKASATNRRVAILLVHFPDEPLWNPGDQDIPGRVAHYFFGTPYAGEPNVPTGRRLLRDADLWDDDLSAERGPRLRQLPDRPGEPDRLPRFPEFADASRSARAPGARLLPVQCLDEQGPVAGRGRRLQLQQLPDGDHRVSFHLPLPLRGRGRPARDQGLAQRDERTPSPR